MGHIIDDCQTMKKQVWVWRLKVQSIELTTAIDNQGDEVMKDKANEGDAQGLNKIRKQDAIKAFMVGHPSGLVCLMETKVKPPNTSSLYSNLFNRWCFTSDSSVAVGDLNCVFNVDERLGSTVRSWEMEDGRRCMEECGLVNVKQYSQFYTWCNRQDVSSRVYSKLDRVMANEAWGSIYEDAIGMFLNEDELTKHGFYDLQKEANIAHSQLIHAQKKLQAIPFVEELISAKRNTHEVYRNKHQVYMSFLRQKAKLQWLTDDDEISTVFHKSIKARRLMNIVYVINDEKGNMKDTLKEVAAAFLDYYQKLLGGEGYKKFSMNLVLLEGNCLLAVLEGIERVYKAYLWSDTYHYVEFGNVSRENVCRSKKAGGLDIKNIHVRNTKNIGRRVWAIATKQDTLWISLIHTVYIKGHYGGVFTPN
ncbi:hypothetical protein RDABS01_007501 [Bienertia sinuspersici]